MMIIRSNVDHLFSAESFVEFSRANRRMYALEKVSTAAAASVAAVQCIIERNI